MQDKIKEQFEKVLTNKTGTYYEITQRIYDFIDQNFIGKEEVREKIKTLHDNSESRTSELDCSQEGYEYGLEAVLLEII